MASEEEKLSRSQDHEQTICAALDAKRAALKDALRPWADAYFSLDRCGYLAAPRGTALMYNVPDPHFLGPTIHDLKPLFDLFEEMVAEDGGTRL